MRPESDEEEEEENEGEEDDMESDIEDKKTEEDCMFLSTRARRLSF